MYRLGLLACDFVPDDLRDRFEDYPVMFAEAIAGTGAEVEWQVFRAYEGQLPESAEACDGYIITGSRDSAFDGHAWIASLEAFVRGLRETSRPLVGICFGHQVIARALGGTVERSPRGWGIGIHHYDVSAPPAWMTPATNRFTVPVCHQDQVMEIPEGAAVLASSPHCENFLIQFNATMAGIQGHPEFHRDYVAVLLELRAELIADAALKEARASLDRMHDNDKVMQWICKFLGIT